MRRRMSRIAAPDRTQTVDILQYMKSNVPDDLSQEALVEMLEDLEDSKLLKERLDGPFVEVELVDLV